MTIAPQKYYFKCQPFLHISGNIFQMLIVFKYYLFIVYLHGVRLQVYWKTLIEKL